MRFKQKNWRIVPGNIKQANLGFNNLIMTKVVSTDARMPAMPVPSVRLGRIARAKARGSGKYGIGQQPPGDEGSRVHLTTNRKADIEPAAKSYMAIVNIYEEAASARVAPKGKKEPSRVVFKGKGKGETKVTQAPEEKGVEKKEVIRKTREVGALEQRKRIEETIGRKEYEKEANSIFAAAQDRRFKGKMITTERLPKGSVFLDLSDVRKILREGGTVYATGYPGTTPVKFYAPPPEAKKNRALVRYRRWR